LRFRFNLLEKACSGGSNDMNVSRFDWAIGLSLLAALTTQAAAMPSCSGQYSAAALGPLPTPTVIALDLSGSTVTSPDLVQAFTRGMQEAGQQVGAPANATLSLSWSVSGQGGGGNGGGNSTTAPYTSGSAAGWGNWSGSNDAWLNGGETAALPGIPSYSVFRPKPAVQSALLFMRAQVRPNGAGVAAWIATLQCTIQPVGNTDLAYQLGHLIGSAMGREINTSPM
jgi:hypothetical protein